MASATHSRVIFLAVPALLFTSCASDPEPKPDPAPAVVPEEKPAPEVVEAPPPADTPEKAPEAPPVDENLPPFSRAAQMARALGKDEAACQVMEGQPGQPNQGLLLAMCEREQLFVVVVGDDVSNPEMANADVLLGKLVTDVKDMPPPQMEKLTYGSIADVPTYVIASKPDDDELAKVYLVENRLQGGLRMIICGWRNDTAYDASCMRFVGALLE